MTKLTRCACCEGPLEPAQQLRFLVETDTLDDPSYLSRIRALPAVNGRPLPVCKACQAELEATSEAGRFRRPRGSSLWGALGALSVGWLLGNLFTARG